jgi:hypothetical protein
MGRKRRTTKSGVVRKIIKALHQPEKAQIEIEDAEHLYREIRVDNKVEADNGDFAKLKPGQRKLLTRRTQFPLVAATRRCRPTKSPILTVIWASIGVTSTAGVASKCRKSLRKRRFNNLCSASLSRKFIFVNSTPKPSLGTISRTIPSACANFRV